MNEKIKSKVKKIAESQKIIGKEVKEKSMGYVLAALGFVVGLAWNDAIRSLIEYLFPMEKNSLWAKFIYAFFVTFLIVIITFYLTRKKEEERKL